jgi:hypothetical protein
VASSWRRRLPRRSLPRRRASTWYALLLPFRCAKPSIANPNVSYLYPDLIQLGPIIWPTYMFIHTKFKIFFCKKGKEIESTYVHSTPISYTESAPAACLLDRYEIQIPSLKGAVSLVCNVVMLCSCLFISYCLGPYPMYSVIKLFKKTTWAKSHNSILQVCNAASYCGWNLHNNNNRKMKNLNVTIDLASWLAFNLFMLVGN